MEIAFRARNVDIPEPLRGTIRDKVTRLARSWSIDRAEVCFREERNRRIPERERCAITLWGPERILRAEAAAADAEVAANRVMGVLERRARRLVGRLTVHFLPNWSSVGSLSTPSAGRVAGMARTDADGEPMTPEDAALEMLAWGQVRWRFVNADSGRLAMLHRRPDGRIEVADLPAALPGDLQGDRLGDLPGDLPGDLQGDLPAPNLRAVR